MDIFVDPTPDYDRELRVYAQMDRQRSTYDRWPEFALTDQLRRLALKLREGARLVAASQDDVVELPEPDRNEYRSEAPWIRIVCGRSSPIHSRWKLSLSLREAGPIARLWESPALSDEIGYVFWLAVLRRLATGRSSAGRRVPFARHRRLSAPGVWIL